MDRFSVRLTNKSGAKPLVLKNPIMTASVWGIVRRRRGPGKAGSPCHTSITGVLS